MNQRTWKLAIFFVLILKAIRSSETSILTRVTRHRILEDGILHLRPRESDMEQYSMCFQ
jgi:hypothetical protein